MSETPDNVVWLAARTTSPQLAPAPSGPAGELKDFQAPFAQKQFDTAVQNVLFEFLGQWPFDMRSKRNATRFTEHHLAGLPNTDMFVVAESMRRILTKLGVAEEDRQCCVVTCGAAKHIEVQLAKPVYDQLCVDKKSLLR